MGTSLLKQEFVYAEIVHSAHLSPGEPPVQPGRTGRFRQRARNVVWVAAEPIRVSMLRSCRGLRVIPPNEKDS